MDRLAAMRAYVQVLAAMRAYVQVVEAGSFVRAAEKLGASTSSTSRLIAELEAHLGARLLNRTTRKLSLTETGQAYYERCVQLLADIEEAEAAAGAAAAVPTGRLKLTCPYNLLAQPIGPALAEFNRRHPKVSFDVTVADRVIDLVDEGFDLAVRIGAPGGEQLVARRLGSTQLVACAAPAYLERNGTPRAPADIAAHRVLTYAYVSSPFQWRLVDGDGRTYEVRVAGPLHANSGELLAWASPSSPISSSGRTLPAASCSGCCRSTLVRSSMSGPSIRAGATCRPRCAPSSTTWPRSSPPIRSARRRRRPRPIAPDRPAEDPGSTCCHAPIDAGLYRLR